MKRSTTGLNVRFFNVTIATGHGGKVTPTGNAFSECRFACKCITEFGNTVMNGPLARKWITRGKD
jgi:hypothetical protein